MPGLVKAFKQYGEGTMEAVDSATATATPTAPTPARATVVEPPSKGIDREAERLYLQQRKEEDAARKSAVGLVKVNPPATPAAKALSQEEQDAKDAAKRARNLSILR